VLCDNRFNQRLQRVRQTPGGVGPISSSPLSTGSGPGKRSHANAPESRPFGFPASVGLGPSNYPASLLWSPGPRPSPVFRSAVCDCLSLNVSIILSNRPALSSGKPGRTRAWRLRAAVSIPNRRHIRRSRGGARSCGGCRHLLRSRADSATGRLQFHWPM